ncbi:MAG: SDR family NAD(P)-dependent oxidoreductase [Mycobacterium sp.]|nr:SDR family NAD(P)-dependent oxidoreductase [Mycobacterium sp.]
MIDSTGTFNLEPITSALPNVAVQVVAADLSTDGGIDMVADLCADRPLTMLVNNADVAHYMPMVQLPADKARELINVKVLAPTMLTRAALPGRLARATGTIVYIAGMLAFSGPAPAAAPQASAPFTPERSPSPSPCHRPCMPNWTAPA